MRERVPTTGRIVAAVLGTSFLAAAGWIYAQRSPGETLQVVGAVAVALLGLDFLVCAIRGRWPFVAGSISLP